MTATVKMVDVPHLVGLLCAAIKHMDKLPDTRAEWSAVWHSNQTVRYRLRARAMTNLAATGRESGDSDFRLVDLKTPPRVSLAIAQATQQNLVVKHNGDVITQVSTTSNVSGKLSIHWWNLLKQYVLKRS